MSELKLVKEGKTTSEYKMSMLVIILCILAEIAGTVVAVLPQVMEGMEKSSTVYTVMGIILVVAGLLGKVLTALGYNSGRVAQKVPALNVVLEQAKALAVQAVMAAKKRDQQPPGTVPPAGGG